MCLVNISNLKIPEMHPLTHGHAVGCFLRAGGNADVDGAGCGCRGGASAGPGRSLPGSGARALCLARLRAVQVHLSPRCLEREISPKQTAGTHSIATTASLKELSGLCFTKTWSQSALGVHVR